MDALRQMETPTPGVLETLSRVRGPYAVLGAGGKMGPTLTVMLADALRTLGRDDPVYAVSRFSNPNARQALKERGVQTVSCDLLDHAAVMQLPDAAAVLFLAGQKFGTTGDPAATWTINTVVPAYAAERYRDAQIVAFSTGCVYPFVPVDGSGSVETDPVWPCGDYAASCVGRERVFAALSKRNGTPVAIFRLNYAVELRYGVLVDIALRVREGLPVNVSMSHLNAIWQGDATARAIQSLELAAVPPDIINVTGPEKLSVRELAIRFGQAFGREPTFTGEEQPTAWLANADRSVRLWGPPTVSVDQMITWIAAWLKAGGETWDKPTSFEVRDGSY